MTKGGLDQRQRWTPTGHRWSHACICVCSEVSLVHEQAAVPAHLLLWSQEAQGRALYTEKTLTLLRVLEAGCLRLVSPGQQAHSSRCGLVLHHNLVEKRGPQQGTLWGAGPASRHLVLLTVDRGPGEPH